MRNHPDPNPLDHLPGLPLDDLVTGAGVTLSPRSVIWHDGDSRRPVEHPTVFPYDQIALAHAFDDQARLCNVGTTFLFAPSVAVSAAHVVQNPRAFRHRPSFLASGLRLWLGYSHGRSDGYSVDAPSFTVHPDFDAATGVGTDVVAIAIASSAPNELCANP